MSRGGRRGAMLMGERRVWRGVRSGGLPPRGGFSEVGRKVGWGNGEVGKERTVGGGWEGCWGRG